MVRPAAARSGRRRWGRPPGIRAAVIARVRRVGGHVSSDFSSTTADAAACGRPAVVDSACRLRSGPRRPFRSSWNGIHRLDSRQDVNVPVDSRRREILLGKRPVDFTIGIPISVGSSSTVVGSAPAVWPASERTDTLSVQVVDRPRVSPSGFPAAVHLYESLVGATSLRCRPRVVPLCAASAFGRPTPLVRGMQPPFPKDYIQLLKATFKGAFILWWTGFVLPEMWGLLLVPRRIYSPC
ncbi:hypothetical protein VPH35_088526 [Triticum aestivum]|uniref:uncharacterized protein isoform X1 n=1 Tax=Triticum aestivum TaxID=4565 RepID=UPI001D01F6C5|nr:uncharacterized protein LOC123115772 isoform X1 [Triticum aestivum]